jgi:hypothetical protein
MKLPKFFVPAIAMVAMALSCIPAQSAPAKIKIGVAMALFDDVWLTGVRDAITKWASEHPDVDCTIVDANNDTAKQVGQVENFLAQGMDAVVILPVDTAATGPMTKAVVKAGKPLVYVNRQPSNLPKGVAYCGSRSIEAGIKVTLKAFPSGPYYQNFAGVPTYVHSHDLGIDMGGWGADWPNGYGFLDELANANAIVSSGNVNISELNDPVINNLFTQANTITGSARTAIWAQVDKQMMKDAAIVPLIYAKALLFRPPNLTNVYVQDYYGMYNYAVLGVKS